MKGVVAGTLSFNVARWNHPRSGEILVSANWSRDKNDASSPYDIHNTLIAAGPDFREHATSNVPTSNVDMAPTLLKLLGLPIPGSMTGRPIDEALRTGPAFTSVRVEHTTQTARTADGAYQVDAYISIAAGRRYLDYTDVHRASR